jgi:two-component system, cell cycle sensor histidine kinase and response regulator CckA
MSNPEILSTLEATRLGLAQVRLSTSSDLARGIERATEASAKALTVARVGLWMWSADGAELQCVDLFELAQESHRSGQVLRVDSFPAYAAALRSRRVIRADRAQTNDDTRELSETYLVPEGISSLLDAPLFYRGNVVGVLCHEHIGPERAWSDRDKDFAISVADLLSVLFEQASQLELDHAIAEQRAHAAKIEKLDALARMGAGLAHDFNNVLTSMMLRAEGVRRRWSTEASIRDAMDAMLQDGQFGAALVRQLFTFAKEGKRQPAQIDVGRALLNVKPTILSLLGDGVAMNVSMVEAPALIHADHTHLEQVFLNLAINARDAGARTVAIETRIESDEVVIEVRDDGRGMEALTLRQIFEPFFTTKAHGTGLGLSTVQSIVQQNGGSVEAQSAPGQGSTFVVRFPRLG